MEFNTHKDCINVCETKIVGSAEYPVDCDITLPEYLPDIVRILRCNATTGVQSYSVTGDRLTAECNCRIVVLYVCEQNKIRCFEQNVHFAKQIEIPTAEGEYFVNTKTEYINYRVSGQRRFEIHGAVSVSATLKNKKSREIICDVSGGEVTTKKEKSEICDLACITEKLFNISETCEAGNITEPIGTVISVSGRTLIDEIKVISDKIFLKGQLIVQTVFLSQDTQCINTVESLVNINQIIEAQNITEDYSIDAALKVADIEVRPRFESAGEKNLLDISACLSFSVCAYETRTVCIINDAYSTKYETEIKKSTFTIPYLHEKIDDIYLCRGVADLNTTGVSKVLSFMCGDCVSAFAICEDGIVIRGHINTDIIYEDLKGEPAFAQRQIPFEYKRQTDAENSILSCNPHCSVTASSFVLSENNRLDLRIELDIRGFVFKEDEKSPAIDLVIDEANTKKIRTAPLTVYFAEAGETLWSIAKKYNTTVDAIIRENRIPDGALEKKCKLLIPKI